MTRDRVPRLVRDLVACAFVLAMVSVRIGAQASDALAWTRVTYISGATIYLEVGRTHGLTERSALDVVRAGAVVARLRVTALSSTRAACEVVPPTVDLSVGDSVRYTPTSVANATGSAAPGAPPSRNRQAGGGRLRGRFGMRYLVVSPDAGAGGGLTQPAYDVRLDGERLGATPLGIAVDARAQRTQYAGGASAPVNATRVYQAALSWNDARSGLRVAAGRQPALALSSVGLFDGVSVDLGRRHWSAGAFAGSQPDATDFGLSTQIREYGLYGEWHTAPASRTIASATLGAVGSYVGPAIDREYGFARLSVTSPQLSVYATQELDVNRGWRRSAERSAVTPTASFASVQYTPTRSVTLSGGIDNRRNARLYRDYIDPEQAFDDAFRQGAWAGLTLTAPRYARLSVDRRESHGGTAGTANSTTIMASLTGLSSARLGMRARATAFDGSLARGQLLSGAVEIDPWGVVRVEANGGVRRTNAAPLAGPPSRLTWWGVDADVGIGRSLYIMFSTYRELQDGRGVLQSYASLSWRF